MNGCQLGSKHVIVAHILLTLTHPSTKGLLCFYLAILKYYFWCFDIKTISKNHFNID